ncbi:MAG: hypothetical protein ABI978_05850 [Chloroflexota bacterium]
MPHFRLLALGAVAMVVLTLGMTAFVMLPDSLAPTARQSLTPSAGPSVGADATPMIHDVAAEVSNSAEPPAPATRAPTAEPTPAPTPKPAAPTPVVSAKPTKAAAPVPGVPCPLFPPSNVWNRDISTLPVAANSQTLIGTIGLNAGLHPDFSATGYGIPFNVVGPSTPRAAVSFGYADESDPGPYPIPAAPQIEGGSDRHMLLWDKSACMLFELYAAARSGGAWNAGSGAIWNLRSNALRPDGWTSADAAGLPILPGLARYDEVASGAILHALRFTAPQTRTAHIYPARHDAGASNSASLPPMGLRVRLKASVDISGFGPQTKVVLTALKRYGMILADNGSPWYVTGAPDARWNDDQLHAFNEITGADFEVVDTSALR